ncbi:MAG: hypothetical protein KatS3mg131_2204 [Candidatus Tectimicrobiota bacterium]|nr:MAG: hypothetical protein KatS3mg131_2204 [Candidatus Tectomicrobia bacterium]
MTHAVPRACRVWLARLALVAVLLAGAGAFWLFDLDRYLSLAALQAHHAALRRWVAAHPALAPLAYMLVYALAVTCSVPGATVLSMAGGLLFGPLWGTLYVVVSATAGATALFVLAQTAVGEALRAQAAPWLRRLQAGFQAHALGYLLVLRLVPLFPFWVVNLVPALLGVRLGVYVLATFCGIIPGAFAYVSVGAGLGEVLARGGHFSLQRALALRLGLALGGLAALVLLPVLYRQYKARQGPAVCNGRKP